MTSPRSWVGVLALVFAIAAPALAQERTPAGRIKVASGAAFVVREGAQIPAQIGQVVFEADGLKTGTDGKVGVTLKDDTRLSLGPNSELATMFGGTRPTSRPSLVAAQETRKRPCMMLECGSQTKR